MKIPKELIILGIKYKIIYKKNESEVGPTRKAAWGYICWEQQTITLFKHPSQDRVFHNFIHELVHGCCDAACINLTEDQTDVLTNILCDTLIRNGII